MNKTRTNKLESITGDCLEWQDYSGSVESLMTRTEHASVNQDVRKNIGPG